MSFWQMAKYDFILLEIVHQTTLVPDEAPSDDDVENDEHFDDWCRTA